jgi:hypothetical protein
MRQPVDLDRQRGQGDVEHRPRLGVWGSRSRVGAENQCPVGAENSVTSCDLQILMDETAEAVSSQWSDGRAGGRGSAACGWVLIE